MFSLLKRGVELILEIVDVLEFFGLVFDLLSTLFHILEVLFFLF